MKLSIGQAIIVFSATFSLIGCTTPASYTDPIIQYQKASTIVIESSRTQYTLANKRARDAIIEQYAARNQKITFNTIEQSRLISAEALQVRIDALDTLAKHGELLLALSSNESASQAVTSARKLNMAVQNLEKSMNLSAGVNGSKNTESLAGPFAELAGKIASLVIEHKINTELKAAILNSNEQVDALINSIEEDMRNLYAAQRTDLILARREAVTDYNCQTTGSVCTPPVKKYTASELSKAVAEIKSSEDRWDNLNISNPAPGFEAMRDAHKQLVAYANSEKKPQDFAQLTEAIGVFVARALIISESIETIRTAQEGN